jgi:hypothetical protein
LEEEVGLLRREFAQRRREEWLRWFEIDAVCERE